MTPERAWLNLDYHELWRYRDLIMLFVWRDFIATYKQTVFGPAWFFISPLMTAVVFTIVFGEIVDIPTDGAPPFLFYLCGTICWGYFSRCLVDTSSVFTTNAALYGKVYFPRLVNPIAIVMSCGINFLIQLSILVGFIVYFWLSGAPTTFSSWLIAFPLFSLQAGILGMAVGLVVSSLTTKYRDLTHLLRSGVQVWMYATPVVYPLSQIPKKYEMFFMLNPMVAVVEGMRKGLLGAGTVTAGYIGLSVGITILSLVIGLSLFTRTESTFIDRV